MKKYNNDIYSAITQKVIHITQKVATYIEKESLTFSTNSIETKGLNDFVSYVDKESEKLLIKALREIIPNAGFITEEGSIHRHSEEYCWVIDPLDGTTNFIHASTPYAISVALTFKGKPVIGVIHEITRNEVFYAWKESKAYLNGKEIKVSKIGKVSDALIATGRPHTYKDHLAKLSKSIDFFLQNSHGIRQSGSAATDLAYVACGRYDGRYEFGLKPWDIAAGVLIVEQAGGKVCDFQGNDCYLLNGTCIASNEVLFAELKENIKTIFCE